MLYIYLASGCQNSYVTSFHARPMPPIVKKQQKWWIWIQPQGLKKKKKLSSFSLAKWSEKNIYVNDIHPGLHHVPYDLYSRARRWH